MTKCIEKRLIALIMTLTTVFGLITFVSTTALAYVTGGVDRASAPAVTVGSTEVYTRVGQRFYKFIAPNTATYTISTSDSVDYSNTDTFSNIYEGTTLVAGDFNDDATGHVSYTASLTRDTIYYIEVQNCSADDQTCMLNISFVTVAPTVTTQAVSSITATTAIGNGNITNLGSPNPTAYGVCWNTTGTPTTADSKFDNGAALATGAFTADMTGLTANTTYYVRAYAINSAGTSYGNDMTFTTPSSDATLKASSTVKGQTVTSLGTPNATLGSETAGSVAITAAKAADTSNTGSFITLFDKNDANATVKVVKYASGAATTNFATDVAYANQAITDGDFFIINVTAQDTTTVKYYRIKVTVTAAPFITTQPTSATVEAGSNTSFSIVATGTGLTYQWQVNTGSGFSNIVEGGVYSGATTDMLSITGATAEMDGYLYRVVVIGMGEMTTNSNSASLTIEDSTAPTLTAGAVSRTSDTAGTVKFTSDEAGSYYYAVAADGAGEPVIDTSGAGTDCTTAETTITNPTGLTAGVKDIYIKVKDAAGNVSTALKIDIAAYTSSGGGSGGGSSSSGSSSGGTTAQQSQELATVIVNGKEQKAGKETNTTEDGKTTIIVEVDNKVIESKIDESIKNNTIRTGNVIQVPVADTKSEVVKVELTGDIVKKLEENTFDVSVKCDNVEYVIPAEEFTISKVAEKQGVAETALEDIRVEVKITKPDEKVVEKYNEAAKANGAELVIPPVSFEVVAKTTKADGTTGEVEIGKFSNYVERVMVIPAGVDPSKLTTGIVFNPDGTYSHVPTEVFQKDGKWYAKLNSLTNSEYSVIWNQVTVKCVENHWSKDAVNDMASRLVIFDPENFGPNKTITRADFAEYIVRALGLYREGTTYENKFTDVSSSGDRTLAILIANEYGIVTGYPDGTFRPDQQITREEAMVMYERAMKITELVGDDTTRYQNYEDFDKVSSWAASCVKEVLTAHVFNGTSTTTISPKSNLTYAEAVQAIRNLLVESKLINK